MNPSSVTAKVLVCDYVQETGGKLTLVGCGFDAVPGGTPSNLGIGLLLDVPWTETNQKHAWDLTIVDEDGSSVTNGDGQPLVAHEEFEVGRPPGCPQGISFSVARALNVNAVIFDPGKRYVVRVSIDGAEPSEAACASFTARPAQVPPANRAA